MKKKWKFNKHTALGWMVGSQLTILFLIPLLSGFNFISYLALSLFSIGGAIFFGYVT